MLTMHNHIIRAIVREDKKLIWSSAGEHKLYDLASDPEEKVNLYGKPEYRVLWVKLLDAMVEWYIKNGDDNHGWFDLNRYDHETYSAQDLKQRLADRKIKADPPSILRKVYDEVVADEGVTVSLPHNEEALSFRAPR